MPAYYDEEEPFVVARGGAGPRRARLSRISTFAGVVAVVGVVGALAAWGWSLGTRDPADVPVIRAAATPAKERPEDPGGAETRHRDVAAFQASSARPGGQVALAPAPAAPAEEDLPMSKLAAVSSGQPVLAGVAPRAASSPVDAPAAAEEQEQEQVAALGDAAVADLPLEPEDLPPPPRAATLLQTETQIIESAIRPRIMPNVAEPVPPRGEGSEQAPAFSPVVRTRPRDLDARVASASSALVDATAELVRKAETSRIQIQLGAYPERSTIEQEWSRISRLNSDILSNRTLAVQQTVSGGQVYYRLRVGPFRDGHEANTVCQALKARGYDCLVAINTERRG